MDTIADYVDRFLHSIDVSAGTLRAYRTGLRKFLSYDIPIDTDALCNFHARLMSDSSNYKRITRENYLVALRRFISWLDAREMLPPDYNASRANERLNSVLRKHRGTYIPVLPDPGLPKVLDYYCPAATDGPRQRLEALRNNALVHVLFCTACRVSEAVAMTRRQVRDGAAFDVIVTGKGEKTRTVFMDPPARETICAYLVERYDDNPFLFIAHDRARSGHISANAARTIVGEAARSLHLSAKTTPHSFRHWTATDMLHRGVPLEVVQIILGHSSIHTTRLVYAHTSNSDLHKVMLKYQHELHPG